MLDWFLPRGLSHERLTAVTSQQSFQQMIKEIPAGHAKELVRRLCGQTHR